MASIKSVGKRTRRSKRPKSPSKKPSKTCDATNTLMDSIMCTLVDLLRKRGYGDRFIFSRLNIEPPESEARKHSRSKLKIVEE